MLNFTSTNSKWMSCWEETWNILDLDKDNYGWCETEFPSFFFFFAYNVNPESGVANIEIYITSEDKWDVWFVESSHF